MSHCDLLERWLEGELDADVAQAFENHLPGCEGCRVHLEDWSAVKNQFAQTIVAAEDIRPPDALEASRFASSVAARMAASNGNSPVKRNTLRFRTVLGAAAAILLGVLSWTLLREPSPESTEPRTSEVAYRETVKAGEVIRSGAGQRREVSIARSRVTVSERSDLFVAELSEARTVLTVGHGTVAFKVEKRDAGSVYEVKAAGVTVTVVGTAFSVSILEENTVRVDVEEGVVRVSRGKVSRFLKEGERGEWPEESAVKLPEDAPAVEPAPSTAARSGETKPGDPTQDTTKNESELWRKMIVEGRLDEAGNRITAWLVDSPGDQGARMILAGVQRRQGRFAEARRSYDRVIAEGNPALANQARYLAGELARSSLRDHRGALQYFTAWLENAPPDAANLPEARLHLAQSLLSVGEKEKARAQLQQIVDRYGHTPVARRANQLLIENP